MTGTFANRAAAGRALAASLAPYAHRDRTLVLGLARGGIPVAAEVATILGLPLDVIVTAKLEAPGQSELALGAVAPEGEVVVNEGLRRRFRLPDSALDALAEGARAELLRRQEAYRGETAGPDFGGLTVILVDDGLATGASMRAAVRAVRAGSADRVVVAVPVGAGDSCASLQHEADEVQCLFVPSLLRAVGEFYDDFRQVTDDEVRALLARRRAPAS